MFSDFLAILNNKFAAFPLPNWFIFTLFLCFFERTHINSHPFSHVFDSNDDAFNANVSDCMPFSKKNCDVGELSLLSLVFVVVVEYEDEDEEAVINRIVFSIASARSDSFPVNFLISSLISEVEEEEEEEEEVKDIF